MGFLKLKYKGLLLALILLCLFVFGFAMLLPTKISTNKVSSFNKDTIISKLSNLSTYKYWFTPLASDTNLVPLYSSNPIGEGAYVKYGDNTLTITKVDSNEVRFTIANNTGNKMDGGFNILSLNTVDTNNINWYFVVGNSLLPWQRFRSVALEKILKPDMKASLEGFEKYMSKNYNNDGLAITHNISSEKYLITSNVNANSPTTALYESANNFRNTLLTQGYNDKDLSKNFYYSYKNKQPFIAFTTNKPLNNAANIIDLSNGIQQVEYTNFKKDTSHNIFFNAMDNYMARQKLIIYNNLRLIKYINWQYASVSQKADEKLVVFCK
jgi:hypothetical protein